MNPHPIASFFMKDGAVIRVELYPEQAPNTVASFVHLAQMGCYDGQPMERLAPDFVADWSYTHFKKECARYLIANESKEAGGGDELPADPGTIVMGGYENGISGGEFFFPFVSKPHIRFAYPAFGKIIDGLDIVMGWNKLPVYKVDFPLDPRVTITAPVDAPVIDHVQIDTFGVVYPKPIRLENAVMPANWG